MKSEVHTDTSATEAERDMLENAEMIRSGSELASVSFSVISTMMATNGHAQAAWAQRNCGCHCIFLSFSVTKDITDGICYDLKAHEAIHIGSELAKMGEMAPEGYLLGLELMSMGARMGIEEYAQGHHFKVRPELNAAMEAETAYMNAVSAELIDAKTRKRADTADPMREKAIASALAGLKKNPIGQMLGSILKKGMEKSISKIDDEEASVVMGEQISALIDKEGVITGGKFKPDHVRDFITGIKSDGRFAISTYPMPDDRSKADEAIKNAEGVVVAFAPRNSTDAKLIKVIGVFGWDDTFTQLVDAADVLLADANETTPQLSNGLAIARGFGVEVATKKFEGMQDLANRYAKVVAEVGERVVRDRVEAETATKH